MSNTLAYIPQTPSSSRHMHTGYKPLFSSPLAPDLSMAPSSPGPPSSPISDIQARRRSQYKSRVSSGANNSRSQINFKPSRAGSTLVTGRSLSNRTNQHILPPIPFSLSPPSRPVNSEETQKAFLRERFKAKCLARAKKVRDREVQRRRSASSDASSDGVDIDMDMDTIDSDEDESDTALNDEILRRVVASEKRKLAHQYALSYQLEVGSSIDPDMEDIDTWEQELRQPGSNSNQAAHSQYSQEEFLPPDDDIDENWDAYIQDLAELEEYEFDEDNALIDEYIASMPLDAIPNQPEQGSSQSSQQLDVNGIAAHSQRNHNSTAPSSEMDISID